MGNKVQILSVKQNRIIHKVRKKTLRFVTPICLSIVVGFVAFFSLNNASISQICNNMCYVYNPVNTLYNDNGNIIFTSINVVNKGNLDFVLPVSGAIVEVGGNGNIMLTISKSIMVKACENGVIDEVGTTIDGIKYIKIMHTIDMFSLIENLDVVGVVEGDTVKRGQDIATAKEGSVVTLKLFNNGEQCSNIKINQSKIVCES